MKNPLRFSASVVLAVFFLVGTVLVAEPPNLTLLKRELVSYVDSGAYEREMATAAAPVEKFITERAANRRPGERLVLVLDIDETVLSNLPSIRENDFGYVPATWDAWVDRAAAPVIAPMLTVFQIARKAGVEVVFITGRKESTRAGTEKNLRDAGLGDYAVLFFKPADSHDSTEKFKTETRRRLVAEGGVIIANVGDQQSDLAGGFAERTFKLPDPFYITE